MNRDEFYDSLYLAHHGILGQKWGVRRFQNKDGSLTPKGKKRYQNDDGTLGDKAEKHIRDNLFNDRIRITERNALGKKMNDELQASDEAKAYNDLIKRRGIAITDRNGNIVKMNLSYMRDDWSNPEKVIEEMVKDKAIEDAYHKKDVEITNKYKDEWCGAVLRDFGYDDTPANRDFLKKRGIINDYS